MSTVVSKNVQIGADGTASNNFTAYQPSTPDGTLRIGNGNSGSVTDAIVLNSSGVVSFTNNPTLSGGTANGVAYLNGSKVLTSGSALTFDGSNLSTTGQVLLENNNYIGFKNTTGTYAASIFNDTSNYLNLYNSGNTGTIFYVNAAEQMRLTSTGLGIGTSSPAGKLHVVGAQNAWSQVIAGNTTSAQSYGMRIQAGTTSADTSLLIRDATNTADYLTVIGNGNVGIGTSSPNTRLQVNSTANTASNNSAWDTTGATLTAVFSGTSAADAGASIAFNDQGNAGLAAIKGAREATSGNGYLSFLTRNGNGGQYATERMRITSAGNVGIGTSSPSEVLEVYGTTPIIQINDRGLYQAQIGLIGNDLEIRGSSGSVEFYTGSADGASSTERLRIGAAGGLSFANTSNPGPFNTVLGDRNNHFTGQRSNTVAGGTTSTMLTITFGLNGAAIVRVVDAGSVPTSDYFMNVYEYFVTCYNGTVTATLKQSQAGGGAGSFITTSTGSAEFNVIQTANASIATVHDTAVDVLTASSGNGAHATTTITMAANN
jgi:hypothetical protein